MLITNEDNMELMTQSTTKVVLKKSKSVYILLIKQFISIMDKRKNNGGAREGAGRKPKAQEQKLIERLDAIIDKDIAVGKLGELVIKGVIRALQLI